MGETTGFMKYGRELPTRRSIPVRVLDWKEVYEDFPPEKVRTQGARCMDCGIPFCHQGCPLGNLIPDWNDLVYKDKWRSAIDRLHATNNFPEFTGRLCPAPCEGACVLGINDDPVTIKDIEVAIIDRAYAEGWVTPQLPATRSWKKVAVIGSGPAGLAAADQLNRAGHLVTVFEKSDRIGGLLRYGIPEFKMEKRILDRRIALMEAEGVVFRPGVNVGVDVAMKRLRSDFDAILLAGGAGQPRDLPVPGRDHQGIHFAMDYLTLQNRRCEGDEVSDDQFISAKDRDVVIIGGGDTGADCLGTAHRQGARSVYQLELMPLPPETRAESNPWPTWPQIFRVSTAHEEGGERLFSVSTQRFVDDKKGRVRGLQANKVEMVRRDGRVEFANVPDSDFEIKADLVLLAMGFVHPVHEGMLKSLGVDLDQRGNVRANMADYKTSLPNVFSAGDMRRGQSLVVWAIREGRLCARAIDQYLMGSTTLPR